MAAVIPLLASKAALLGPAPLSRTPLAPPASDVVPEGRMVEIGAARDGARTSLAVSFVIRAQAQGELVAWVQPRGGALYPPDLDAAGVDLSALVVIHVPVDRGRYELPRAAELLLRSGGFGLVVLDLSDGAPAGPPARWQGRLSGVLRKHGARLVLLAGNGAEDASLGPLVSLRLAPRRRRVRRGVFAVETSVLRDKLGLRSAPAVEERPSPPGLG